MKIFKFIALSSLFVVVGLIAAQDVATPIPVVTDVPIPTQVPCVDPAVGAQNNRWQSQGSNCSLQESVVIGVSVSYPQALGEQYPFAKAIMLKYINQVRRDFWEDVDTFVTRPDDDFHAWQWSLDIKSEIFQHSQTIASVFFTTSLRTGGSTQEQTAFQTYTFDLAGSRTIALRDLFVDGVDPYTTLAPLASAKLREKIGDGFMNAIVNGTIPVPENYAAWVLNETALVLYFPGERIGVAGLGTQVVTIPLVDLGPSLRPEFLQIP
jgi:hypothetical protein